MIGDISAAEKGGYEHFMAKEIMEQPKAVRDTISPRLKDGRIVLDDITLTKERKLNASLRSALLPAARPTMSALSPSIFLRKLARIPVEVDVASAIAVTANRSSMSRPWCWSSANPEKQPSTLAALREAKRLGARTLSIVNVVGSLHCE